MKIEVKDVSKKFKNVYILKNVNLVFEEGHIYGFQGRNGSGKTVLLKLLCGLYKATNGTIFYDNQELKNNIYKFNVGALIENPKFFSDLTGYENLKILANINRKIDDKEIMATLELVNLVEEKDKKYSKYSLGMKQKLGIAQAIMEDPKIIFLDEPFNGIEEKTVVSLKKYLQEIKKDKIIIISSHIKEDLESLADNIYQFDDLGVNKIL